MRLSTAPDIAPDGSALAFILRDSGVPGGLPQAMQAPLVNGVLGEARPVRIPMAGPAVAVKYSPHAHWLAVEIAVDGTERTEIWLVSTDPADPSAVLLRDDTDTKTSLVEWDSGKLAVDAVRSDGMTEARLVSPEDGSVQVIDHRVDGKLVAAAAGYALMRVGPRANRELLLVTPDGGWRPLLAPQSGSTTDAGCILPPRADGEPVLLVCSDHSSARRRVLRVHAKNGVMRSRDLITHREADVDEFCVSRDEETAAVLWNLSGRSTLELLRLDDAQRVSVRRSVTLPGMVAHGLTLTGDGSVLALTVESPDAAPMVHLVDTRTGVVTAVDTVGSAASAVGTVGTVGRALSAVSAGATVNTPELLHYTSRDGMELSGWLYRAPGVVGPAPTLLHFHGGPEGQSRPEHHDVLRAVMDAGVSVFTPNVRGSFGSGREFLHADNRYGRFAGIRDLEDSALLLVDAGISDPDRLAVSGRSYGGYLVNIAVTWFPELFRAAVCACGMSDLETFYRDTEPWVASAAYPKYGYPIQDGELLRAVSPLHRVDQVDTPVLFIHGLHDTNVPPSEYVQMKAALDAHGVLTEALELEDEGHEFVRPASRKRIAEAMVAWLRRHGVADS